MYVSVFYFLAKACLDSSSTTPESSSLDELDSVASVRPGECIMLTLCYLVDSFASLFSFIDATDDFEIFFFFFWIRCREHFERERERERKIATCCLCSLFLSFPLQYAVRENFSPHVKRALTDCRKGYPLLCKIKRKHGQDLDDEYWPIFLLFLPLFFSSSLLFSNHCFLPDAQRCWMWNIRILL